jgi:hypothetical protein
MERSPENEPDVWLTHNLEAYAKVEELTATPAASRFFLGILGPRNWLAGRVFHYRTIVSADFVS